MRTETETDRLVFKRPESDRLAFEIACYVLAKDYEEATNAALRLFAEEGMEWVE